MIANHALVDDPGGDGRPRRRHAPAALRVRRGPSPVRRRRRRLRRASERRRSLRPAALASGRRGPPRQPRPRPRTPPQRSSGRGRRSADGAARACSTWRSSCPRPNWQTAAGRRHGAGPGRGVSAPWCASRCARGRPGDDQGFGQECDVRPLNPGLLEAADQPGRGARADARAGAPAARRRSRAKLGRRGRQARFRASAARIEGVARSLANRCELTLEAWRAMLRGLHNEPDPPSSTGSPSSASSSARSMSACTATISTPPSRS